MRNKYRIRGDIAEIYLEKYKIWTQIDASMIEKVLSLGDVKWIPWVNRKTELTYVIAVTKNKTIFLHRELTNCPKGLVVDHVNYNTLDNRLENLRITTIPENARRMFYQWHPWHDKVNNYKVPDKPPKRKSTSRKKVARPKKQKKVINKKVKPIKKQEIVTERFLIKPVLVDTVWDQKKKKWEHVYDYIKVKAN